MAGNERLNDLESDLLESADAENEAITPSRSLRETLLGSVSSERRFEGFVSRLTTFLDFDPARTRQLLEHLRAVSDDPWEDGSAEGVRLFHFDGGARVADAHCGLVQVEPGVTYPFHRHQGDEWSFVLRGTAREDNGRVLAPGDLVHNPPESRHSFTSLGPEPFVFVAVVREGIEHL